MTFLIRDAARADIEDVIALYEAADIDAPGSHGSASVDAAWRRLHETSARVLLALEGGRPVGTLTVFVLPSLGHDRLGFQRHGISFVVPLEETR